MRNKKNIIATEEYHNTILLLKQYRMMKFQADLKKKQYEKKASFDNILSAKLEQEWAEIQLNDMLLNDIITAFNFVKDYPSEGALGLYHACRLRRRGGQRVVCTGCDRCQ